MKGSSWEGGIRVPGIAWWPGRIPGGRVVSEPCATLDLFPTVCGVVGIDARACEVDGFDIMPLLDDSGAAPQRAVYGNPVSALMEASLAQSWAPGS